MHLLINGKPQDKEVKAFVTSKLNVRERLL